MIDGISGNAKFICSRCGELHTLEKEDFFFETVSVAERGMGPETQYISEHHLSCTSCGNEMHIEFKVWEYPTGVINHKDQTASGASKIHSEFEIIYSQDEVDSEEKSNRVVGAVAGGAILGGSIGGPIGALIGGLVGGFLGDSVNKSKKGGKDNG